MIPTAIMPFRIIGTEHFILWTDPGLRVLDPIILIVCHSRSDIRLRLRFEVRVLLFDLLDLLLLHFLATFANGSLALEIACAGRRACCSCTGRARRTSRTRCTGYWSCA